MTETQKLTDFILAIVLTVIGAALASGIVGGIPLIGIDDAAITRSYADNIARGAGYVYNIGGERVEGSTTLLWASILTVVYSLTSQTELPILVIAFVFTCVAMFCALRLLRLFCSSVTAEAGPAMWVFAVCMIASPGYFMWSVWTMMELALWSMLVLALTLLLARRVEGRAAIGNGLLLIFIAMLLPITRPEGIMVSVGLLILALLLYPHAWRSVVFACAGALGTFIAATAFRLSYFGQPFPNTFYAKVSSDRLQDLADGVKYLFSYLLNRPFAEILVAFWFMAALWALASLRDQRPGARAMVVVAATVFGMLSVYAALGGDHFALWRFYQPISPLLPIIPALIVGWVFAELNRTEGWLGGAPVRIASIFGALALLATGWVHYYQSRFDVLKEYELVEKGLSFGEYLNEVEPNPTIGVGPAGGIALAYEGEILDLLGLNWTEMAHANPIKVGMRNHASFHKPTFWKHAPDVLSAFNRACGETGLVFWSANDDALDGLFSDEPFREAYLPVRFED